MTAPPMPPPVDVELSELLDSADPDQPQIGAPPLLEESISPIERLANRLHDVHSRGLVLFGPRRLALWLAVAEEATQAVKELGL